MINPTIKKILPNTRAIIPKILSTPTECGLDSLAESIINKTPNKKNTVDNIILAINTS